LRRRTEGVVGRDSGGGFVDLALFGWVDAFGDQLAGGCPLIASRGERHVGIGAERQHLLLAGELIAKAPPLAAIVLHEEIQTVAV
jgi:hypothetical protein